MSPSLSLASKISAFALMIGALLLLTVDAHAQNMSDMTKSVGTNVRNSVPLIPMVSYVCGVFFTASGLLKLKDWVNDGERNPLTPAIMRLVIAVFLIMLPASIRMVTGTFFRRSNGDMSVNIQTPAPSLGAFCKSGSTGCN